MLANVLSFEQRETCFFSADWFTSFSSVRSSAFRIHHDLLDLTVLLILTRLSMVPVLVQSLSVHLFHGVILDCCNFSCDDSAVFSTHETLDAGTLNTC